MHQRHLCKSIRNSVFAVSSFVTATFLVPGCAGNSNHPATAPSVPVATPIVNLDAPPTRSKTPIASDEPLPPEQPTEKIRPTGPLIGQRAPHINAEFVSGIGPTSIEEARGKVVLIDFWATFCAPCSRSFPQYQALANQFHDDLVVLAISVDDADTDKVTFIEFLHATGVTFPVLWDKDAATARAYNLPKMPTSFIVDRSGTIRYVHAGYSDETAAEMAREIKTLLAK